MEQSQQKRLPELFKNITEILQAQGGYMQDTVGKQ